MKLKSLNTLLVVAVLAGAASLSAAVNGPIGISPDGRYFVDKDGAPFLWVGDTAWPLFVQYTPEQAEAYLVDRARKGYSVVQAVLIWGLGSGMERPTPLPNSLGEAPWVDDDPLKPNEAYFKHVDRILDIANQQGLVVSLGVAWGYYIVDRQMIDLKNARAFGRQVGSRYKDTPNLIFANGGDRVPLHFEEVYRELARGLREGDGGAHLITYHPSGWRSSSEYFHGEDWLDFNSIQTWGEWYHVHDAIITDGWMTPAKPAVLAEGAYEGGDYPRGLITPLLARRQAWFALTSGGFYSNGHTLMWRMDPGWESALDAPGAAQVGRTREILKDFPWWEVVPDQGLFLTGAGSDRALNTACRTRDGNHALIYLSSQCHVFINLEKFQARLVRATWINPATGEERDAGTHRSGNDNGRVWPARAVAHFYTPDGWEDALIRFDPVPDTDPALDGVRK